MERGPHLSRATTARKPLLITLHSYFSSFPSKSQFNIVIIIIVIVVVVVVVREKLSSSWKRWKNFSEEKIGIRKRKSEINESGARLSGKGKKEVVN